jgi:hypothetical protein
MYRADVERGVSASPAFSNSATLRHEACAAPDAGSEAGWYLEMAAASFQYLAIE